MMASQLLCAILFAFVFILIGYHESGADAIGRKLGGKKINKIGMLCLVKGIDWWATRGLCVVTLSFYVLIHPSFYVLVMLFQ